MEKNRKFLKLWIYLALLLFIYNPYKIFAGNPIKNRVLSLSKGAYIVYESSSFSEGFATKRLINERPRWGWRSKKGDVFPHIIVFELICTAKIDLLKFNNNAGETAHPGISTKKVQVEFSTVSSDSGYINAGTFILKKGKETQEYKIQKNKARWIRLSIISNYGHPSYTELMEFEAWGAFELKILQIISFFTWILGGAVILSAFSYHEFLAQVQKAKRTEVFKRNSFKRPFLLGLILVATGINASIHQPFLAAILGVVAFLLLIWFVKFIKIQAASKQEN